MKFSGYCFLFFCLVLIETVSIPMGIGLRTKSTYIE